MRRIKHPIQIILRILALLITFVLSGETISYASLSSAFTLEGRSDLFKAFIIMVCVFSLLTSVFLIYLLIKKLSTKNKAKLSRESLILPEQRDYENLIQTIIDNYKAVFVVNLKMDEIRCIESPFYFNKILTESGNNFSEAQKIYVDQFVKSEYAEKYHSFIDLGIIAQKLENDCVPEITYEKNDGSYLTLRIYKSPDYSKANPESIWMYFNSTEKSIDFQKQVVLNRAYMLKISVSMKSKQYTITSFFDAAKYLNNLSQGDYAVNFESLLNKIVFPDERNSMRTALSYNTFKAQVESGDLTTKTYRFHLSLEMDTIFVECNIFFIKLDNDVLVTLTFRNITSEISDKEELNKIINDQARQLKEDYLYMLDAINAAVEFRDNESAEHEKRIRENTKIMLHEIKNNYPEYYIEDEEIEIISVASAMHDVGKIAIPDAILLKPGKLSTEEFEIMKQHTIKGCEMLDKIQLMRKNENYKYYYNICRWHHEKFDGKGYPDGLMGNDIPIYVQAVSVADCFDALISDRPYKKAYPPYIAKKMIIEGHCGKFNPHVIDCFKKVNFRVS